jgi:hypothetical protein
MNENSRGGRRRCRGGCGRSGGVEEEVLSATFKPFSLTQTYLIYK